MAAPLLIGLAGWVLKRDADYERKGHEILLLLIITNTLVIKILFIQSKK